MTDFQPLSVRRGKRAPTPFEDGVPARLLHPVSHWLEGQFGYRSTGGMRVPLMQRVALVAEVPLSPGLDGRQVMQALLDVGSRNGDVFLDIIDATLADERQPGSAAESMRQILDLGRSAWRVSDDGRKLEWRVDPVAQQRISETTSPQDRASAELSEAWAKAYGLQPDPADAWDHAIKAVEEVLIPLVLPGVDKANLGGVAGELASNSRWQLEVGNQSADSARRQDLDSARTLEAMLRLMWPDPQRHGGGAGQPATQLQAESVVQLAVTIVQWVRSSALRKR